MKKHLFKIMRMLPYQKMKSNRVQAAGRSMMAAWAVSVVILLVSAVFSPLFAQIYPAKPIRIIVPFAPGGRTDIVTRQFQRVIEQRKLLSQPLVVVNVDGGGGTVGGQQAKDAPADGYTLLAWHVGMIASYVLDKVKYAPTDFEPIAETGTACYIWSAAPGSGFKTIEDVVTAAKAAPGTVIEATSISSAAHFASMLLCEKLGIRLRYVESGGTAKRIQMLIGNHAKVGLFSTSDFVALKDQGLSALVSMAPNTLPTMPEVKTLKQLGYDLEWCSGNWWFGPKGMPKDRVATIVKAIEEASKTTEIQDFYRKFEVIPSFLNQNGLAAILKRDTERLRVLAPLAKQ